MIYWEMLLSIGEKNDKYKKEFLFFRLMNNMYLHYLYEATMILCNIKSIASVNE